MRQREEEMRDTNESTNSRVLYFSIFSMCCLLGNYASNTRSNSLLLVKPHKGKKPEHESTKNYFLKINMHVSIDIFRLGYMAGAVPEKIFQIEKANRVKLRK